MVQFKLVRSLFPSTNFRASSALLKELPFFGINSHCKLGPVSVVSFIVRGLFGILPLWVMWTINKIKLKFKLYLPGLCELQIIVIRTEATGNRTYDLIKASLIVTLKSNKQLPCGCECDCGLKDSRNVTLLSSHYDLAQWWGHTILWHSLPNKYKIQMMQSIRDV